MRNTYTWIGLVVSTTGKTFVNADLKIQRSPLAITSYVAPFITSNVKKSFSITEVTKINKPC